MAEWNDSPDLISAQDVLSTEIIVNQALIDILIFVEKRKHST